MPDWRFGVLIQSGKSCSFGEPAVDTAALTARLRSQGAVMEWKKNP